jgi:hypothetical protein
VSQTISLGFGGHADVSGLIGTWGDAFLGVKDSLSAAGGIIFDFSLFLDAGFAGVSGTCSLLSPIAKVCLLSSSFAR